MKISCENCKHVVVDETGSWMDKSGLFHYIPSRYYCLLNQSGLYLSFYKEEYSCGFYEPRGKKERIG